MAKDDKSESSRWLGLTSRQISDEEAERLSKIKLATLTYPDGTEVQITGLEFLGMISSLSDEAPTATTLNLLEGSLDYVETIDEIKNDPIASETLAALRKIYNYWLAYPPKKDSSSDLQEDLSCIVESGQTLPTIKYKKSANVEINLDKFTTVFFGPYAPDPNEIDGQLSFALDDLHGVNYAPSNSDKEIMLYYNYIFDKNLMQQLGLEKAIDAEDFFILSYLNDAYKNGNRKISVSKFYREMNEDDPNATQKTELQNRLMKLSTTHIFINNREVAAAWAKKNGTEDTATYREMLIPVAPITIGQDKFVASGKVVNGGIYIHDAPPVLQTGLQIGQYTTVPKNVLRVKDNKGKSVKKTPRFYRVLMYLIQEIAHIKDGRRTNDKILYDTFYKDTGETTTRGKQAAKKILFEILDHFIREGWIDRYKEEETKSTGKLGVKIFCKKNPKIGTDKTTDIMV